MAECESCGAAVDESELVETKFGRICPDCQLEPDVAGGGFVSPTILFIVGGIGAVMPFVFSIARTTVQAGVGHFDQTITKTKVALFSTSPSPNATSYIDFIDVIGGAFALLCGAALLVGGIRGASTEAVRTAVGGVMVMSGLYNLYAGLGFLWM